MSKNNRKSARKPAGKVHFQHSAKGLSSQAGLIPVLHFLNRIGFDQACQSHLDFQRADNARYSLSDALYLTIIGIVAGATSLMKVVTVWADGVLRELGGWNSIPDDSTLGRIFRLGQYKHVVQLEQVNHLLRQRVWSKALKSGALLPGMFCRTWIDVDSTVRTVYGEQEGAEKGYNTHKRGARSYHPLLAFCSQTKEILQAWLRSGSACTSNGVVGFMQQLAAQMPPRQRLLFRGDAGYFIGELMSWLDEAKNQMGLAQIKSHDFMASSLLFQCAVLAYNTVRWMALLSGNDSLQRWEMQTVRT